MSSSAWQRQWSYLSWQCKKESALFPYEKASVCSFAWVPMHVETITFAAFLMGLLWSSQFNGTACLSLIWSRTARNGCNRFSDIVKKKMLVNKKARAKSSRYVQSVSGCHDLNVRSWSGPTVNSQEGMSGYAKPSADDSPAADILATAGQMLEVMSLWIAPTTTDSVNFGILLAITKTLRIYCQLFHCRGR